MTEKEFEQIINDEEINDLIWSIVHKYSIKGYTNEDLYQECVTFLHSIISKYDSAYKFSTFITVTLENNLKNMIESTNTKKRKNYIKSSNGKVIELKDVKNFNFNYYCENNSRNKHEKELLYKAYKILDREKWKDLFLDYYINDYKVVDIANKYNLNNKSVYRILDEIKKKLEKLRES